jgi:hypothetical protein
MATAVLILAALVAVTVARVIEVRSIDLLDDDDR